MSAYKDSLLQKLIHYMRHALSNGSTSRGTDMAHVGIQRLTPSEAYTCMRHALSNGGTSRGTDMAHVGIQRLTPSEAYTCMRHALSNGSTSRGTDMAHGGIQRLTPSEAYTLYVPCPFQWEYFKRHRHGSWRHTKTHSFRNTGMDQAALKSSDAYKHKPHFHQK